jgi:hypothetical protein
MGRRVVIATVIATIFALPSAAQKRIDLGNLTSCDASQNQRWQTLQTELSGVETRDPYTPGVGWYSAGRFGFAGLYLFPYNWLPMSATKQTMCGRFERFDWNPLGKEQDWNLRIIPSVLFDPMFVDAKQYASNQSDVWTCDPTPHEDRDRHQCGVNTGTQYGGELHNCFEAEVTPREDRFDNSWFSRDGVAPDNKSCSTIVDDNLCVYGPYITEAVHGNRPEIHPLEAIWWRNRQGANLESSAGQDWTLLHVQDASGRYNTRSNFSPRPGDDELDWAPWAESPRVVDFRIGVEVASQPVTPLRFSSDEEYADGVVLNEPGKAERAYIASYRGRDIFELTEKQSAVDHYQVGFEGLCITQDARVRMFLSIRSTVGIHKRAGHQAEVGFHGLHVWNNDAANVMATAGSAPLSAVQGAAPGGSSPTLNRIVPSSIRAVRSGGRLQLVGRLETLQKQPGGEFSIQQFSESVPVDSQSLVAVGEQIGLFQRVLSVHESPKPDLNAGRLLGRFLGVTPVPQALVQRVSDTVFTAAPQFALIREGAPAWEDSEELLGDFNARLAAVGRDGQVALLANTNPQSNWTFEGWTCGEQPDQGCTKRSKVGVVAGKPPSPQPDFIYVDSDVEGDTPRFHVYFPSEGTFRDTLLLLIATGAVTDPDTGQTRTVKLQFYNIAIPVKGDSDAEAERIVTALANLLQVPVAKLSVGEIPNILVPFAQVARYRQAEMLRLNIKHAAEGEVIEPETMSVFLRAAQRLSALP